MGDVAFNAAIAVGIQAEFGTINGTIEALDITAGLDTTDGLVMGDYEAGDGRSGIVIPSRVPLVREKASAGRTRTAPSYIWTDIEGLQVIYQLMGNGKTATPAVGEAIPHEGIHALNQGAGLKGANGGANCEYDYVPAAIADLKYLTIKLWVGNTAYVYKDCVVNQRQTVWAGGIPGVRTDSILVGSLVTSGTDLGIVWPTGANAPDYTNQATLDAPVGEGFASLWGHERGFNALTVEQNNNFEKVDDLNVDNTGKRFVPGEIEIKASGVLYREDSDNDFEYEQSIYGEAATDIYFQAGTPQTGAGVMNAYKILMPTPRLNSIRDMAIQETIVGDEFELLARGATEASEYEEMYN